MFLQRGVNQPRLHSFRFLLFVILPGLSYEAFAQKSVPVVRDSVSYNVTDCIHGQEIQPGTDRNGAQLLKRLRGVVVNERPATGGLLQSIQINGMGARYNPVMLNGALAGSLDAGGPAYSFQALPAEAIRQVSVTGIAAASMPGNMTGGSINIDLTDRPDKNFVYVLAGSGMTGGTGNKDFLGDRTGSMEWLGIPGNKRDLPAGFPTTRSRYALSQKNPQEQVYWSKLLNNNLAPVSKGDAGPASRVLLGFGRNKTFKKGEQWGILAWLNYQRDRRIDESIVQVAPDVTAANSIEVTRPAVWSQSKDISYGEQAQLTGILATSLSFKKSKLSLKAIYGSQTSNTYTERSGLYKPDEDSVAHRGMNYSIAQRSSLSVNVSGGHLLGAAGKLQLDWLAAYDYFRQRNPDERNFLLRQDAAQADRFAIATPQAASLSSPERMFTNTGRSWKQQTDHGFTGQVNISFPFSLFRQEQRLTGGVYIQNRYRVLYSDLLLVNGAGYYRADSLLSDNRYYPGGLSAVNFYNKYVSASGIIVPDQVGVDNRGNYTGSSNIGAAYFMLHNRFMPQLSLDWGVRVESVSNLVSTAQYNYFPGYQNAQVGTLDENDRVINFSVLPSATITFTPLRSVALHASFFASLNRPELQELSRYRSYDPLGFMVRAGNPALDNTPVRNYEAGIAWTNRNHGSIALRGFYKTIDRPIEYIVSGYAGTRGTILAVPYNAPPATVKGIVLSLKTDLAVIGKGSFLQHVVVFANGTVNESAVEGGSLKSVSTPKVTKHTLSGTPKYSANGGLVIQYPRYPHLTVLYSKAGDHLEAVGSGREYLLANGNRVLAYPDYRVKGREQLDVQVSQQFLRTRLQVVAGVNNLTNNDHVVYQDLNGNEKFDTPLKLKNSNNTGGYYESGTDNTILSMKWPWSYYVTLSYLF